MTYTVTITESNDLLARLTQAVRKADLKFEQVGGSSRHWVRECLLPELEAEGLAVVDTSELAARCVSLPGLTGPAR